MPLVPDFPLGPGQTLPPQVRTGILLGFYTPLRLLCLAPMLGSNAIELAIVRGHIRIHLNPSVPSGKIPTYEIVFAMSWFDQHTVMIPYTSAVDMSES